MAQCPPSLEVIIWADATQTALVHDVLDRLGTMIQPIAVGGPSSHAMVELANHLDCTRGDDFRKLMIDRPAAYVLLATARHVTTADVLLALNQGTTVLALEPVAAGFDDWPVLTGRGTRAEPIGKTGRGLVISPGAFLRCPGWIAVADPIDLLARPRLIQFTTVGTAKERSLFARFFEAWQVILRFCQVPHTVDATIIGPLGHVPDNLRALTGHMTAHARFDDAAAVIIASDAMDQCKRTLTLTADEAHLRVDDSSYELHDASGHRLDDYNQANEPLPFADLVANDWARLIDHGGMSSASVPQADQALACCLACLLSARTGQVENPAKILAMQR